MIRHSDGSLDYLHVLSVLLDEFGDHPQRFIVPIRIRPANLDSRQYYFWDRASIGLSESALTFAIRYYLRMPDTEYRTRQEFTRLRGENEAGMFSHELHEEIRRNGMFRPPTSTSEVLTH